MRNHILSFAVVLALASGAMAQPRVIITEIMYNPASTEKQNESEWIEIANVGNESIEIKDWTVRLADKRARWGAFSCTLAPGAVAVLVNAAALNEEQFRAAWDALGEVESEGGTESAAVAPSTTESQKLSYLVIPVKWGALTNTMSADHPLQLLNEAGEVVCEVKHSADWPKIKGGPSVYLTDITATNISDGKLWRASESNKDGGRKNMITAIFDKEDSGSPGFVPGLTAGSAISPAPTAPAPPTENPATPANADKPKTDDTIDY